MVSRAVPDGHGRNVVNVILVDFRGFDTLGEITVLAVAVDRRGRARRVGRRAAAQRGERHGPGRDRVGASGSCSSTCRCRLVFHAVLMVSLWLLFAGHNQPGGGFVGGLVAGAAIALRYIAGGIDEVRGAVAVPAVDGPRRRPAARRGHGGASRSSPASCRARRRLTTARHLPLARHVKLSSALVFDIGVYLTVVGMVLMVFEAFGDEPAEVRP